MQFETESNLSIKAFYNVYNQLGYGFLEKVYENAMMIELKKFGIVNDKLILELKAAESICEEYEAQLLNYLKATDIEIGLLFNFGKQPQFKRKIFENKFKNISSIR